MRPALLPLAAAAMMLAGCGDPVDETDRNALPPPVTPPVVEASPAIPEPVGVPGEAEAGGNVPTLAELQVALATCQPRQEAVSATCEATDDRTEFSCRYSLDGDTPETERETIIAADGDNYTLVDIPEDCRVQ